MSPSPGRSIKIEITVEASQRSLLQGLDVWLRLNLISQEQVKQLCQTHLICPLPQETPLPSQVFHLPSSPPASAPDFLPLPPEPPKPAPPAPPASPASPASSAQTTARPPSPKSASAWTDQILRSLLAELSVVWLLCLGVFLVVVSSALLAATQWQRLSPTGQYLILWSYTVATWAVSGWTQRRSNLRLTTRTLQVITLLLAPVNFWAMDGLRLWQNFSGSLVSAIAAFSLTFILIRLYPRQFGASRLQLLNLLGLSYLHWGWRMAATPLLAVYGGILGTTLFTCYQVRSHQATSAPPRVDATPAIGIPDSSQSSPFRLAVMTVVYAMALLLLRAVFIQEIEVQQLGLAIGIGGWLLGWLAQQSRGLHFGVSLARAGGAGGAGGAGEAGEAGGAEEERVMGRTQSSGREYAQLFEQVGVGLLGVGWWVSVGANPGQAIAVSGLGVWLAGQQLVTLWRRLDLAILLGIGLQMVWLAWRLIPVDLQQEVVTWAIQWTGAVDAPQALLGVALFPYVVLMVGVSDWLYRRRQSSLGQFGERLALGLGSLLTVTSGLNSTAWTLNLIVSTVTLAIVTARRQPLRVSLVYLTHIVGLVTLIALIDQLWSPGGLGAWACIGLALTAVEWTLSLGSGFRVWRRSAWRLGVGLAGLSYVLLQANLESSLINLSWLVTPIMLTAMASRAAARQQTHYSQFSALAVCVAPFLPLSAVWGQFFRLGLLTLLMGINTYYWRRRLGAGLTLGFGLWLIGLSLQQGVLGITPEGREWLVAGAIAVLGLWFLCHRLQPWLGEDNQGWAQQAQLYGQAANVWALVIAGSELLWFTANVVLLYGGFLTPSRVSLGAIALLIGAMLYHRWRRPDNQTVLAVGWGTELLLAEAIRLSGGGRLEWAAANVGLGLVILVIGGWLRSRQALHLNLYSLTLLPWLYALIGMILRFDALTRWSGLLTLGAATIGLAVGRRIQQRWLEWLSLAGVSLAWYELVTYRLLQVEGGYQADGWIILTLVAAIIMLVYRCLAPWLSQWLNFSRRELVATAHIHWALGGGLLCFTGLNFLQSGLSLKLLAVLTGLVLFTYALAQARTRHPLIDSQSWVYLGFVQGASVVIFGRLLWPQWAVLDPWWSVIACGLAWGLYGLPWTNWNWPSSKPWKTVAVCLPIATVILTLGPINSLSLVIVAGFYLWLTWRTGAVRLSYLSLGLLNWAIARWLLDLDLTDGLVYVTPWGLSLLYIAQIDPTLKQPEKRQLRHTLRLAGLLLIQLTALLSDRWTGIPVGMISLLTSTVGLMLKIRALLYVGSAIFVLNAFNQLVILNAVYPFMKWVVGILAGFSLIWIAATFETRREQLASLVRDWVSELATWE